MRVGILDTVGELSSTETFLPTIAYLRERLAEDGISLEASYHDIESLRRAVERQELDFFISNPGFFAVAQQTYGLRFLTA